MVDRDKFTDKYSSEIDSVSDWSDEIVNACMGDTLTEIFSIQDRMNSSHEITMNELTWVLFDLPIQLIHISEALSKIQLSLETIKLTKSHNETEFANDIKRQSNNSKISATELKQIVASEFYGDNIGIVVYESSISQIERYISLSKELIMGAKKIWQRRVDTEEVNPVMPVEELPEYGGGAS